MTGGLQPEVQHRNEINRLIGMRSGGFDDQVLIEAGADELYDGPEDLLRNYESSLLCRD